MKNTYVLFFILLIVSTALAQTNGINYKAIVKDNAGTIITNDLIVVEFTILQGAAQTNVYKESHTPTTDSNGLIILNIGEGTIISGDFTLIDWATDDHFLNVQINIGGGLTNMGTTALKSVPYALQAEKASNVFSGDYNDLTNVPVITSSTGLEALDEGNGLGWRLIGRDPLKYGDIGFNAIDLSRSSVNGEVFGATGHFSFAVGSNNSASGHSSTAFGTGAHALGTRSIALGSNISAESYAETVIGVFNTNYIANSLDFWDINDRLFAIGNGTSGGLRSDAFMILKDGTITAPSFEIAQITDDKALITKEYADANYNDSGTDSQTLTFSTDYDLSISNGNSISLDIGGIVNNGLEALDEGNGLGWRLIGVDPNGDSYGQIGIQSVDLSYSDSNTNDYGAINENTFATGYNTRATNLYATALGRETTASGINSTAMGQNTVASGSNSTAMGDNTSATGFYTTAMGENTFANSKNSLAIGRSNIGGGNPLTWIDADPLFEIGNGDYTTQSNALTILKNGTITAPSFDILEITDNKALITKEFADTNYNDISTGLETLDEGNGIGYRIKGIDPLNYGNIGLNAVDLSSSDSASTLRGATGNYSTAMGANTTASGVVSTVFGVNTTASGNYSFAYGQNTTASGWFSTSFGLNTTASGYYSTASGANTVASGYYSTTMGSSTVAPSYAETVIGAYNTDYTPIGTTSYEANDRLFVVGNGTSSTKSDALIIQKNGTITAPSFDISAITDNKALITKEYADANYNNSGTDSQTLTFDTNTNDLSIANGNTVNIDGVISGLEALDEGNGTGYRIKGRSSNNYGNVGFNSVDLSYSNENSSIYGPTGERSFTSGAKTTAEGSVSTALGFFAYAKGSASTAIGYRAQSESFSEIAIGSHNTTYTPNSTISWDATDRLFVVGNGPSNGSRSDALTILKNGTITAPSFDISEITDDKALITKEYTDVFAVLERLDEGNGIGFRIRNVNPAAYGAIGLRAVDLSFSIEVSPSNGATGNYSFASGLNNKATGDNSTVLGFESIASSYVETAIGSFNTFYSANSTTAWDANDRLFVVGNGANIGAESNALTIYKNGKMAIGNVVPDAKLHIEGGVDAGIANGTGYVVIGDLTGQNMVIDQNEIIARVNGANGTLFLNQPGGDVWAGGALVHSSDRRLKRDITNLEYGLDEVLQLQPKQYFWKNRPNQKQESLGLVAQEIQEVIANIVHQADDEQATLSISYTELIPVLINAIKEQQTIISDQNNRISDLKSKVDALKSLEDRLQKLEVLLKNSEQ